MPATTDASAPVHFCAARCHWALSLLLLLVGLGLSAGVADHLLDSNRQLVRSQFESLARERLDRLQERLDERLRDLDSVRRFFASSREVSAAEFKRFAAPLLRDNLVIAWAPRLDIDLRQREQQLQRFTERARVQVGSAFALIEADARGHLRPLQARDHYYPLLFVASRRVTRPPLGLDMASPGPRREALQRALASGRAQISRSFQLVGPAPQDRQGVVLVAPVHPPLRQHGGSGGQAAEPSGLLFGVVSLRQLLESGIAEQSLRRLAVELYDLTPGHGSETPVYRVEEPAPDSTLFWQAHFKSGDNLYRLDVRPSAEFLQQLPPMQPWQPLLPGVALSLLLACLLLVLLSQRSRALRLVDKRTAELRTLAITDPLTGIHNRRYCMERLDAELARSRRDGSPLALIMFDIDHFKRINDSYGHDAGDRVLKEVCRRIGERLRRSDAFCRMGGEEFVVLCPATDAEQAAQLAEELRLQVRAQPCAEVGLVCISLGVTVAGAGDDSEALLQRIDRALYRAKAGGRDRACLEAPPAP